MRNCPHCSRKAALLFAWPMLTAGCLDPSTRLNAPPQGSSERPNELQETYVPMVDNGMMHDLSVSEIHFIPHTAQLSGTGVRRLNRYGELLEGYGGTIHLDTVCVDETLNQARVQSVSTYLASTGLNMTNVKVETGLPQGRGMDAPAALRVLAEGTAPDGEAKASGGSAKPSSSGSSSGK